MTDSKDYLIQLKDLHIQIENKIDEIIQLKELANRVTSCLEGERVQGTPNNNKLSNNVINYICKENELKDMLIKFNELKSEIESMINQVDNSDIRNVLFKKYILFKSFGEIAYEMSFSKRWINELHNDGLNQIDELLH